jgi:inhibitor of cysteine peptidase
MMRQSFHGVPLHQAGGQRSRFAWALLILLGVLLLGGWGCGGSNRSYATDGGNGSVVTLTQTDQGKSVRVGVGEKVEVTLPENPTTGFQWALEPNPDQILKLEGSTYVPPAPQTKPGGGGTQIFSFSGQTPGTATLQFKLWREWQGDASVRQRFSVTVQVQD